jgi:hypothetical protein
METIVFLSLVIIKIALSNRVIVQVSRICRSIFSYQNSGLVKRVKIAIAKLNHPKLLEFETYPQSLRQNSRRV